LSTYFNKAVFSLLTSGNTHIANTATTPSKATA
jgi:hypothetical protein